jgi:superfamily II DNA or RNA helicase
MTFTVRNDVRQLREYQQNTIDRSIGAYKAGRKRQFIAHATGLGKTCIMVNLAREYEKAGIDLKQVWIVVPTEEIATQTKDEVEAWDPSLKVMIEKADEHADKDCNVIVASAQSIGRKKDNRGKARTQRFDKSQIGAVVVDECHRAGNKMWDEAISNLGIVVDKDALAMGSGEDAKLLIGFSATPRRTEGDTAYLFGEEPIDSIDVLTGIKRGWLADVKCVQEFTKVDLKNVKVEGNDFEERSLVNTINTPERNAFVVAKWKKHLDGKSTIVYCRNRAHVEAVTEEFKKEGVKADFLTGEHSKAKREDKLRKFRNGETTVLVNCAVLREGFNMPSLLGIVMASPTVSENVYLQPVGRVIRRDEQSGKVQGTLLDIRDVSTHHRTIGPAILAGIDLNLDPESRTITKMDDAKPKRPLDTDGETDENAELVGATFSEVRYTSLNASQMPQTTPLARESRCPWVRVGDRHYVLAWQISPARKGDLKYRKNQKPRRVRDLKGHLHVRKLAGEWVAVRVTEIPMGQKSVDKWGVDPTAFHVVGRYATRKEALRRAEENLFEHFQDGEVEKFKERYYISGTGYKKELSALQKQYNLDSAVNQGEYSNYQTIKNARKYVAVWQRIKRNPRNAGVLNDRPLPNGDYIDRFGVDIEKSSCKSHNIAA